MCSHYYDGSLSTNSISLGNTDLVPVHRNVPKMMVTKELMINLTLMLAITMDEQTVQLSFVG